MLFSLPILTYHSISLGHSRLSVPPLLFEEHCKILAENGWRGISLAAAEQYALGNHRLPKKSFLFTFDDGYLDNYVNAEPILRKYGHHGVIFPVASLIEKDLQARPNLDDLAQAPHRIVELPSLNAFPTVSRANLPALQIFSCRWSEVQRMHAQGTMAIGAHSLHHGRIVRSLQFTELYGPNKRRGFFSVPPYAVPWGFPYFDLGHALVDRAYTVSPALFDLIQNLVPQVPAEAKIFLEQESNQQKIRHAIAKLPTLGTLETKKEHRTRIAEALHACRDIFTKHLGTAPVSFCWPWGRSSKVAYEEAQRAGFKIFFKTGRGLNAFGNHLHLNRFAVRRISGDTLLQKIERSSQGLLEAPYGWMQRAAVYGASFLPLAYRKKYHL